MSNTAQGHHTKLNQIKIKNKLNKKQRCLVLVHCFNARLLLSTWLPSWQWDLTGPIMLIVLFLVSHFNYLFVPCGGLSWLPVSFLLHVKYTVSYRIVSYLVMWQFAGLWLHGLMIIPVIVSFYNNNNYNNRNFNVKHLTETLTMGNGACGNLIQTEKKINFEQLTKWLKGQIGVLEPGRKDVPRRKPSRQFVAISKP